MTSSDQPPGVGEFDLDRSTEQAWTEFAARLADVIAHMDPGAQLTIGSLVTENQGQSPFVRFTCGSDRKLVVEASANAVLSQDFRLTPDQLSQLERLGWHSPNLTDEFPTPNYWRDADQDDSTALAEEATHVLRHLYKIPHPAFLAPDQLAEILTPMSHEEDPTDPDEFEAEEVVATVVRDRQELDRLVAAELTHLLSHPPLRDADGDYALRVGSTMVFIRTTDDAREVLVFAVVVHDVEGRSRAMEVLSDLNSEARFVRFLLIRDRVFVSMSIFAQPFVPAHLHQALKTVSMVADQIDEHLAAKLRGRTTFTEEH